MTTDQKRSKAVRPKPVEVLPKRLVCGDGALMEVTSDIYHTSGVDLVDIQIRNETTSDYILLEEMDEEALRELRDHLDRCIRSVEIRRSHEVGETEPAGV